jgi:ParB-like chromosome segregation protein Spo0J
LKKRTPEPTSPHLEETAAASSWPADRVERRSLKSLIPYANNPRQHPPAQIDQLVASITKFGFTVPILVDEKGVILAGHGRAEAAQKLGLSHVPVIVAKGWTEAQKIAYRIIDNAVTDESGWDSELLATELVELEGMDFKLPEFDLEELLAPEALNAGPDAVAASPRAARKTGTIFVAVPRARMDEARKVVAGALTKAKIEHNL